MTDVVRPVPILSIDLLRDEIAPKATNQELSYFSQVCTRLDLSPYRDEIVLVPRWSRAASREVHRHQVTVHGRRVLAQRTGEVTRLDGPYWTGPRNPKGDLDWVDLWADDDRVPYAARFYVGRVGLDMPANGTVKWSEFCPTDGNGKPLKMWTEMPSHMLGKTAESLALRRAFPEVLRSDVLAGYDDQNLERDVPEPVETVHAPVLEAQPDEEEMPPPVTEPLELTQSEAHAVIGSLPKAQQLDFLAKHKIADFGLQWPPAALEDAAHEAEKPF